MTKFKKISDITKVSKCMLQINMSEDEIKICSVRINIYKERLDLQEIDNKTEEYRMDGWRREHVAEYMLYRNHHYTTQFKKQRRRLAYYKSRLENLEELLRKLVLEEVQDYNEIKFLPIKIGDFIHEEEIKDFIVDFLELEEVMNSS